MATIALAGNPCNTSGQLPSIGEQAPDFTLTQVDLSTSSLNDFKGKKLVLNIYPSIDTGVCASSTHKFNQEAASLDGVTIACVSRDLPFAMKRFCGAEGIDNLVMLSDFKNGSFGHDYGLIITSGPLSDLHSRAVVIVDESGKVIYTQQVPDITQEPDYAAALSAIK